MQTAINHIAAACAAAGIEHTIICPGSRNAPLTMAFARHPAIKCQSVIDERSAGFIALGMAQRGGVPVAVICTSGSAVVNLYPAVVEAFYQRLPLIVITADRPPELIDQWDGQTIHQNGVFGKHVKQSITLPDSYDKPEEFSKAVIEGVKTAFSGIHGPVHINVPLREPLYGAIKEEFVYPEIAFSLSGLYEKTPSTDLTVFRKVIKENKKILGLVGEFHSSHFVAPGFYAPKIPFICDVLSNQPDNFRSLYHTDLLLSVNNKELKNALQPDILITFGTSVVSKNIKLFLRNNKPKYHFHISAYGEIADPFNTSPVLLNSFPGAVFEGIEFTNQTNEYYSLWQKYDDRVGKLSENILTKADFNEMTAVYRFLQQLPEDSILHLANSMPVRWVSMLEVNFNSSVEVRGNRGTSGIDGCTSTAVGAAYFAQDEIVTLLTGDVAFFYDSNALWNNFVPPNLRIVILNNSGGGIFRLIDGPGQMPELEQFVETQHTRTARLLAEDMKVGYASAHNYEELDRELETFYEPSDRPKILEIFTDSKITAEFFKNYKKQLQDGLENLRLATD